MEPEPPWNVVDPHADRPSREAVVASWSDLAWEPAPVESPAVARYLGLIRATHVNGGAVLGRFRAVHCSPVTQWFVARNRNEEYELLRVFFEDPVVRDGLSTLQLYAQREPQPGGLREQWAGSLILDGILAHHLVTGGAHRRFEGPAAEAKALGGQVVDALFGDRFEDVRLDISFEPWTPWFGSPAWSTTLVLTDRGTATITVLCITDVD